MEEIVTFILHQLSGFPFAVALVSTLLGGEIAVLGLAFLAGQGNFTLLGVLMGSFVGMLLLDIFFFLLLRFPITERVKTWGRTSSHYREIEMRIASFAHGNDILILLVSKMLIGTRVLILSYLSMRNISLRRFLAYDVVATALWALVLVAFGWYSGHRAVDMFQIYDRAIVTILYALGVVASGYALLWSLRRWITQP